MGPDVTCMCGVSVQWGAYGQSKLANLLHAQELDHRCQEAKLDIRAHSLHPGVIQVGPTVISVFHAMCHAFFVCKDCLSLF